MKSKLSLLWSLLCVYYNIILNFTLAGFHHTALPICAILSLNLPDSLSPVIHPSCGQNDERILCGHIMVPVLKWLKARIYLAVSRPLITVSISWYKGCVLPKKRNLKTPVYSALSWNESSTTWLTFSWSSTARDLSICTKTLSAASQILSS